MTGWNRILDEQPIREPTREEGNELVLLKLYPPQPVTNQPLNIPIAAVRSIFHPLSEPSRYGPNLLLTYRRDECHVSANRKSIVHSRYVVNRAVILDDNKTLSIVQMT